MAETTLQLATIDSLNREGGETIVPCPAPLLCSVPKSGVNTLN